MKKRIIVASITLLLACTITACKKDDFHSSSNKYFCSRLNCNVTDYLDYLENFDYENYEIIDISKGDNSIWFITYKLKDKD